MNFELYDRKKTAAILGISLVTLDRLRRSGEFPYRQIGGQVRFLPEDIEAYLKKATGTAWPAKPGAKA